MNPLPPMMSTDFVLVTFGFPLSFVSPWRILRQLSAHAGGSLRQTIVAISSCYHPCNNLRALAFVLFAWPRTAMPACIRMFCLVRFETSSAMSVSRIRLFAAERFSSLMARLLIVY